MISKKQILSMGLSMMAGAALMALLMPSRECGVVTVTPEKAPEKVESVAPAADTKEVKPTAERLKALYAMRLTTTSAPGLLLHFSSPEAVKLKEGETLFVEPAVEHLRVSHSWWREAMELEGDFKPETTYTVTVKAGAMSEKGKVLLRDTVLSVTTPALEPSVDFYGSLGQMALRPEVALGFRYRGCKQLKVTAFRAFENNVVMFGQTRYQDELLEQCGEKVFEVPLDKVAMRDGLLPIYDLIEGKPGAYRFKLEMENGAWDECYVLFSNLGASYVYDDRLLPVVAVQRLTDGTPVAGASVALYDEKHQCIAMGVTNATGVALTTPTPRSAQRKETPVPKRLVIHSGEDMTVVNCNYHTQHAAYAREVSAPPSLPTVIWPDRDGVRPGEVVHLYGCVREASMAAAAGVPLTVSLVSPHAQVLLSETVVSNPDGCFMTALTLPEAMVSGTYQLKARLDGEELAQTSLYVADFTANHVKLSADFSPEAEALEVTVMTYFGSAVKTGHGSYRIQAVPSLPEAWSSWSVGTDLEAMTVQSGGFSKDSKAATLTLEGVDAQDLAIYSTPVALVASVNFSEPNARSVTASARVEKAYHDAYLGLRYEEATQSLEMKQLVPEGQSVVPRKVHDFSLVRLSYDYVLTQQDDTWRYQWQEQSTPVALSGDLAEAVTLEGEVVQKSLASLPAGHYQLTAMLDDTVATTVSFWHQTNDLGKKLSHPSALVFKSDKCAYAPGEEATLTFDAPIGGSLFVVQGDTQVRASMALTVEAGRVNLPIMVPSTCTYGKWYVGVTLVGKNVETESRFFGVADLSIDHSAKALSVTVEAPEVVRPSTETMVKVKVSAANGSPCRGTLALVAVDEAVLDVTQFETPDVFDALFQRKGSTFTFGDLYGSLLPQLKLGPDGRIGGDKSEVSLRRYGDELKLEQATTVVTFPLQMVDASGELLVPVKVPEFAGSLRFMAVVANETMVGADETTVVVRTPVTLSLSSARYGCEGDEVVVTARVENHDLPAQAYKLTLAGETTIGVLAEGKTKFHSVRAKAGTFEAVFAIEDVEMRATHTVALQTEVPVQQVAQIRRLAEGETLPEGAHPLPSIEAAQQVALDWLAAYPYKCTEQLSARMLPYTMSSKEDERALVKSLFESLMPRLSPMGTFTLWEGESVMHPMATLVASHVLIEAHASGILPSHALPKVLEVLQVMAQHTDPKCRGEAAYAAWLLGEAGAKPAALQAARHLLMTKTDDTPAFVAAVTLILNGAAQEGAPTARAFLAAQPRPKPLIDLYMDEATAQAMVLELAMRAGVLERDAAEARLATLLATPWQTTQANAWAARAIAACEALPKGTLYRMMVPTTAVQANGPIQVKKSLFNREGKLVSSLTHGELGFVVIDMTFPTQCKHVVVRDRLPGGVTFEDGALATRESVEIPACLKQGKHFEPHAKEVLGAEVRFFGCGEKGSQRLIYPVRATTQGRFAMPAVVVEEMYHVDCVGGDDPSMMLTIQ